jgi:hypothetical protein
MAKAYSRSDILDMASECITKDRAATHGDMEENFSTIAAYWSIHLGVEVSAVDCAIMCGQIKLARLKSNAGHADNWVDLVGYAACGGELAAERPEGST